MAILYHYIDASTLSDYTVTKEPQLPNDIEFIDGERIEQKLPNPLVFEVNYPSKEKLPHFVGMTIPVLSTLLVDTLRSAGVENFQVVPAVLRNPKINAEWGGYWAFNVIGLIAAANLELSEMDTIEEDDAEDVPLMAFQVLVLDKSETRNASMFRLAENPGMLLIHDRVLQHLIKHRPANGWGFVGTEIETV